MKVFVQSLTARSHIRKKPRYVDYIEVIDRPPVAGLCGWLRDSLGGIVHALGDHGVRCAPGVLSPLLFGCEPAPFSMMRRAFDKKINMIIFYALPVMRNGAESQPNRSGDTKRDRCFICGVNITLTSVNEQLSKGFFATAALCISQYRWAYDRKYHTVEKKNCSEFRCCAGQCMQS